jgi:hypothetical protein
MSTQFSNINVISNIYPVKTVKVTHLRGLSPRVTGLFDDHAFRLQIRCRRALVILSERTHGAVIDDQQRVAILLDNSLVSAAQIKAYWDDGRCADCPPGEKPWGLGKNGIECRCTKTNCAARNQSQP